VDPDGDPKGFFWYSITGPVDRVGHWRPPSGACHFLYPHCDRHSMCAMPLEPPHPPNQVVIGLSLLLTFHHGAVYNEIDQQAISPTWQTRSIRNSL
jgi:hypothetical protein